MDSTILELLSGSKKVKLTNESDLTSKKPSTFTASFSNIEKVYSILPGQVMYIGVYKDVGSLTILVSDYEIVRYLNVSQIQVQIGDTINSGRHIGIADKRYGLQFEYCSQWQGQSKMPVRLSNRTFFKQNPMDLLNGVYVPKYNKEIIRGYNLTTDIVELSKEQEIEFQEKDYVSLDIDKNAYQITEVKNMTPSILDELSNNY